MIGGISSSFVLDIQAYWQGWASNHRMNDWWDYIVHLFFLIFRPTGPSSSLYSQDEWLAGLVHIFLDIQAYWA